MKNVTVVIFGLFFVLAGFGLSSAADQDVKGSKDPSLLSRMPSFHISAFKSTEFDSHRFINEDKKPVNIEGHKYYIEYRLDKGAAEPGEQKICWTPRRSNNSRSTSPPHLSIISTILR